MKCVSFFFFFTFVCLNFFWFIEIDVLAVGSVVAVVTWKILQILNFSPKCISSKRNVRKIFSVENIFSSQNMQNFNFNVNVIGTISRILILIKDENKSKHLSEMLRKTTLTWISDKLSLNFGSMYIQLAFSSNLKTLKTREYEWSLI